MTELPPGVPELTDTSIPIWVVDELLRGAFAAGRQYAEDEFEPGIVGVFADGNTYRFVWGGPDQ